VPGGVDVSHQELEKSRGAVPESRYDYDIVKFNFSVEVSPHTIGAPDYML
jgi:hypothetical protein